jgi:hypothetical protein
MSIQLVLTDDWELRGDGSGNMRRLQFDTIRRLCDLYEQHGLRGSFNAEVLQQLAHLRVGEEHSELAALAGEWEEIIKDVYGRGHDVQLHLHPQWVRARYVGGRWELSDRWSMLDYSREEIDTMLGEAKQYLEALLSAIDKSYRCVSFRSGSWCIAPSRQVLPALVDAGIVFDTSIVEGLLFRTRHVTLDYRDVDESFLPFYPDLTDARRLASEPQPIVCVPTHSFQASGLPLLARVLARRIQHRGFAHSLRRFTAPADATIHDRGYDASYSQANWSDHSPASPPRTSRLALHRAIQQKRSKLRRHCVSDLSTLSLGEMRQMLSDIRRKAAASGWNAVPVVLENHTKDVGDFRPLERFFGLVSRAREIQALTLTEVAGNIERGDYPVRFGRE